MSADGLRLVPGTSPAGGMEVDLLGRFQLEMRAALDSDGRVVTECVPPTMTAPEQ